jgi:hypothetical protein
VAKLAKQKQAKEDMKSLAESNAGKEKEKEDAAKAKAKAEA